MTCSRACCFARLRSGRRHVNLRGMVCAARRSTRERCRVPGRIRDIRRCADDIAAIQYTSGTTGTPKGVMHSHRQLLHRAWVSAQRLEVGPGCRTSQIAEIAFATGAVDVLVPLLTGATVCPFDARSNSLRQMAHWLHRDRIEVVRMPVALFHRFLDALEEGERFPHVRYLQPAGKLYWPSVDRYRRHFARECRLVRQLAATETSLLAMMMVEHDSPRIGASVPVGYPVPGKELWLERSPGVRAGIGEAGEIVVKSRYLFAGIWRRPDTASAPGEARLHRTGDLARWLPDGSLEFVGRIDSRVKIRGFTVDLDEVEAAIGGTGVAIDSIVVADEDAAGETQLAAYVVPANPHVAPGAIRTRLAEHVPNYMIPSHIVLLDALPLTPNGKVDRAALPKVGRARQELPANHVPPRTPIEVVVAAIWEDVLRKRADRDRRRFPRNRRRLARRGANREPDPGCVPGRPFRARPVRRSDDRAIGGFDCPAAADRAGRRQARIDLVARRPAGSASESLRPDAQAAGHLAPFLVVRRGSPAPNAAGVPPMGSSPCFVIHARTSASRRMRFNVRFRCSTIAGGVPTGATNPDPGLDVEPWQARLDDRRHVRQQGRALVGYHGERADATGMDRGLGRAHAADVDLDFVRDQRRDGLRRAAIGDVHELDSRQRRQLLGVEMAGRARACRCVVEPTGAACARAPPARPAWRPRARNSPARPSSGRRD